MSYIPSTGEERKDMLQAIGLNSFEELYVNVPSELVHNGKYTHLADDGLSEFETLREMEGFAAKNKRFGTIFRGAGAYRHYIPSCVKHLSGRSEFVTAYTPYQAEMSQGVLQAIFEYQTAICMLTGMDVSNASVYDGATAAAEAVSMCREKKQNTVIVSEAVNPYTLSVIRTYSKAMDINVLVCPAKDGQTDLDQLKNLLNDETAAVYAEIPNYFGIIEDGEKIAEITHTTKAKFVAGVNPVSLGVLTPPGEYGADIAVGDAQPLGMPLSFGGPYVGFMSAKKALVRKLPGRIVGETKDLEGKRAYVLTLQAREQHIRREKASSSICSNQALCALTATIYCAAMGPQGLYDVASQSMANAQYLKQELAKLDKFEVLYPDVPTFHEFVTSYKGDADKLLSCLEQNGVLGGLPLGSGKILWCATEVNTKAEIDCLVKTVKECDA